MKDTEKNLISVYVAADEMEAHHLKQLLAEQGIESEIVGTGLIGGTGELPPGWSLSPRIWVEQNDQAQALKILEVWESERNYRRNQNVQDWICPSCRVDVPGEFEICWQCQGPLVQPADQA